jgi:hypothetical protein
MLGTNHVGHHNLITAMDVFQREIKKDQPDPARVREFAVRLSGMLNQARKYAEQQQAATALGALNEAGCTLEWAPEKTMFGQA